MLSRKVYSTEASFMSFPNYHNEKSKFHNVFVFVGLEEEFLRKYFAPSMRRPLFSSSLCHMFRPEVLCQ